PGRGGAVRYSSPHERRTGLVVRWRCVGGVSLPGWLESGFLFTGTGLGLALILPHGPKTGHDIGEMRRRGANVIQMSGNGSRRRRVLSHIKIVPTRLGMT
ncbi:MAG: hypothetical protein Q4B08_02340, partial [Propionibacteriaceae bacterium]|nr:hypothetical protein [Propionibacteriaceae bacterium]